MNTLRIAFAAVAIAAFGVAQASEITEFPLEKSIKSRAEVQAEARTVRASQGALYDGSLLAHKVMPATMKSRDEVRLEARAAKRNAVMENDLIGGM